VILERDADKWFKPARGQFQMFYKLGDQLTEDKRLTDYLSFAVTVPAAG